MLQEFLSRRKFLKSLTTGLTKLLLFASAPNFAEATATYPYSVQKVNNEYRLFREGRQHTNLHFMSIITADNNGSILCIRPHPNGLDNDNAWGSSLYMQPFLPGATLRDTIVQEPVVDNEANDFTNGITISASGKVCKGVSETFGDWTFNMKFSYINDTRIESPHAGRYSITLDDKLAIANGDLNLFKIASNYLHNVPRIGDINGDTGDMSRLDVFFNDRLKRAWIPTQGTTYPSDSTNILTLNLLGNYNNVDTLSQGHSFRIEPAFKPNLKVRMKRSTLDSERTQMILRTAYYESQSQDFSADNVGITPLILKDAPETIFNFDVSFESTPFEKNSARGWNRYE